MKFSISWVNNSGWSLWIACPAPGTTSTRVAGSRRRNSATSWLEIDSAEILAASGRSYFQR